ncbi:CLUMA_CG006196, isoform A [Clunio marinus]|uniref:CLUMA_CG006196, isoform A n=1 Tax=Clunio marinus TaxID=568069 RepID=A0A1J1HX93_9DIPT|nr:CLUMA_CG006196, isoform A [Clunio marinus]
MLRHLLLVLTIICFTIHNVDTTVVKEIFEHEEIFKDVIGEATTINLLNISYPSGVKVNLGNILTPTEVKDEPTIEFKGDEGAFYALLMTDPDAPSRMEPTAREFRHWLKVNIPSNDLNNGETIVQFAESGPPMHTGLHRYIFLLFKQIQGKSSFNLPFIPSRTIRGRISTSTKNLKESMNLELVAGNFFLAEYDEYVNNIHEQFSE